MLQHIPHIHHVQAIGYLHLATGAIIMPCAQRNLNIAQISSQHHILRQITIFSWHHPYHLAFHALFTLHTIWAGLSNGHGHFHIVYKFSRPHAMKFHLLNDTKIITVHLQALWMTFLHSHCSAKQSPVSPVYIDKTLSNSTLHQSAVWNSWSNSLWHQYFETHWSISTLIIGKARLHFHSWRIWNNVPDEVQMTPFYRT
jgi:hypothetical protein